MSNFESHLRREFERLSAEMSKVERQSRILSDALHAMNEELGDADNDS